MRQVFGGGKQEEQVKNLYSHMQEWYKSIHEDTKLAGKLTVERLRTSTQMAQAEGQSSSHQAFGCLRFACRPGVWWSFEK